MLLQNGQGYQNGKEKGKNNMKSIKGRIAVALVFTCFYGRKAFMYAEKFADNNNIKFVEVE